MGEDYKWVNVDKREYIEPFAFDYGARFHQCMSRENEVRNALHSLLSDEWKGDRILWIGDSCSVEESYPNDLIRVLYEQTVEFGYPEDVFDLIYETYRDVSGLFKEAEECVREYIGDYIADVRAGLDFPNEFGIDINHPFRGMFQRETEEYRYTINYTKGIYYELGETAVVARVYNADFSTERYYYEVEVDPLSLLLGYGENAKPGEWLGDAIGVSNQRPEGFFRIPRIYLKYYPYYHNECALSRRMVRRMPESKESIAVYPAKIEEMTR